MSYGITQCYLPPPGSGDFPAFTPEPKLVRDLATPKGCKAELSYVVVTSPKALYLPGDGHLSQKQITQAVS